MANGQITCGNRAHVTATYDAMGCFEGTKHKHGTYFHFTVAEVRACFAATAAGEPVGETIEEYIEGENMQREYEAERAVERYFEEGPHGPVEDRRERELWAIEDMMRATRESNSHTL